MIEDLISGFWFGFGAIVGVTIGAFLVLTVLGIGLDLVESGEP
jgi:hypothetical protein